MPLPVADAFDYLWQFQRLLPRGRVWQRGWGSVQAADLLTLMPTWARIAYARGRSDLPKRSPAPSRRKCCPSGKRRSACPIANRSARSNSGKPPCARSFRMRGGQSINYFIALAAANGFTIEITQFSAFRVDMNSARIC